MNNDQEHDDSGGEIVAEYEAVADIPEANVLAGDRILLRVDGRAVLLRNLPPEVIPLLRRDLGHALQQLALDDPRVQAGGWFLDRYSRGSGIKPPLGTAN